MDEARYGDPKEWAERLLDRHAGDRGAAGHEASQECGRYADSSEKRGRRSSVDRQILIDVRPPFLSSLLRPAT